MKQRTIVMFFVLSFVSLAYAIPETTLTETDFTYIGAFKLPDGGEGSSFHYAQSAMTLANNSFFVVSHPYDQLVAEISIPEPSLTNYPRANLIQQFIDVTQGRARAMDEGNGFVVDGLEYFDNYLYWTARMYYQVDGINRFSHGMSNTDFSNLRSAGSWWVGSKDTNSDSHNLRTSGYMLSIPPYFSDKYLNGWRIASGGFIHQGLGRTSVGPSLYVFETPSLSLPADSHLNYIALMYYPCMVAPDDRTGHCDSTLPNFKETDGYYDLEWVYTKNLHSVIAVGRRGGTERYVTGDPTTGDCDYSRGYHGEPYSPSILFYDPADFAKVANGEKKPTEIKPYHEWNPKNYFHQTCEWKLMGIDFDPKTNRLFIMQVGADGDMPLIYVFEVNDDLATENQPPSTLQNENKIQPTNEPSYINTTQPNSSLDQDNQPEVTIDQTSPLEIASNNSNLKTNLGWLTKLAIGTSIILIILFAYYFFKRTKK